MFDQAPFYARHGVRTAIDVDVLAHQVTTVRRAVREVVRADYGDVSVSGDMEPIESMQCQCPVHVSSLRVEDRPGGHGGLEYARRPAPTGRFVRVICGD